ncbi:MAG TPA: AAC(3) family N-acetyltransferase [Treponemataceae bacterium]|jgi:aminoglycoside 3-N-acetyltransferase|nr:AAC(3) family N-acetyltransferase [Treponemataceae bacterium]HPX25394.1 AAC(3) family N-acetyltransferase [Treponemataceae bacterium]
MAELESVGDEIATVSSLKGDFKRLGLSKGMTVIVHASLRSFGWVCGGPVSVILALEEVLGSEGTLVMPSHSYDVSDPANWENPPVPSAWIERIRNEMPLFHKDLTPTTSMGKIAETFRKQDGVVRSSHPSSSFCARGRHKDYIVQDDKLDFSQNEQSPLGRFYELGGYILLIGVAHEKNTSLHLAEYKADYSGKKIIQEGYPCMENGKRVWKTASDIAYKSDDFPLIGYEYEAGGKVKKGYAGKALCRLINQRDFVDFAVTWMERNRRAADGL